MLDFDATDDRVHGQQVGRFYHGYYDAYCFLPLYVCGDRVPEVNLFFALYRNLMVISQFITPILWGGKKTERVGFEPTDGVNRQRFSRPPHSTTLPPLR